MENSQPSNVQNGVPAGDALRDELNKWASRWTPKTPNPAMLEDILNRLAHQPALTVPAQTLEGRIVSVDVSTCDDDALNRIFAELTGETASDGETLIAIEQSRNFGEHQPAQEQAEPFKWPNGCDRMIPRALRYLANNPRPSGGEETFNGAHLYQLAGEMEAAARKIVAQQEPVAAPQQPALGKSLLRPAISATNPLPPGCYCKPGQCAAPVIMGRQTPCRDPAKRVAQLDGGQEGSESNG